MNDMRNKAVGTTKIGKKPEVKAPPSNKGKERKAKNLAYNEARHSRNKMLLVDHNIKPEKTEKIITRVTKHGKKVNVFQTTVEKQKRPSQLLRKFYRARERGAREAQIAEIQAKLDAETALAEDGTEFNYDA